MKIVYVGGAGRLGYPLAWVSANAGHQVLIADTNEDAVEAINKGEYYTNEPLPEVVFDNGGWLLATTKTETACTDAKIICVIVPTPSLENGSFSLEHVLAACDDIGEGIKENSNFPCVIIVSTVNPGDCQTHIKERINRAAGHNRWGLFYSPEFVRQGSIAKDFTQPDLVILGTDDPSELPTVRAYYDSVTTNDPGYRKMSLVSAEIAKIGLNTAITAKLAVANQLAWMCHLSPGADAREVLDAIGKDTRIGSKFFSAGAPDGGPCFPRDGRALVASAASRNAPTILAKAVDYFREWQLSAIVWHVGAYAKLFDAKTIGVLGLTYKPGVDIVEEAVGPFLVDVLSEAPGLPFQDSVFSYDPALHPPEQFQQTVEASDLLVITTNWPKFKALKDMDLTGKTVFDLWGMFFDGELNAAKYIRLGKSHVD